MAKRRKSPKRGKAGKARRGRKKRTARRRAAGAAAPLLAQMSAYRSDLMQQQAALQTEIDKLADAIGVLGGRPTAAKPAKRRPRGRPKGSGRGVRKGSLKSYILKVMRRGQVMAVKDVSAAVRRAGYKTTSSNFANQVSNALAQIPSLTKVSRGKFRA